MNKPEDSKGSGNIISTGNIIIAIVLIVGLCFILTTLTNGNDEEATRPRATTAPTKPDLDYTLITGEEYGAAGARGHSYRMIVPENASINDVFAAGKYEAIRNKANWDTVTIFVYNGRDPRVDGNYVADRFYQWVRATDKFAQCSGPC